MYIAVSILAWPARWVRETISGNGRTNYVEDKVAVVPRGGKKRKDVEKLHKRTWPAMGHQQRTHHLVVV